MKDIFYFRYKSIVLRTMAALCLIFTLILTSACGSRSQKPNQQQSGQENKDSQQKEQNPEKLKELEGSVEKLIKALNGPAVLEEDKQGQQTQQGKQSQQQGQQGQQQGQQGQQQQGQQGQQGQQQGQQGQQQGQQGQQQGQQGQQQGQQGQQLGPQQGTQESWENINKMIVELHSKYNEYGPSAVKLGASRTLIDNMSNALNNLTNQVNGRNKLTSLLAANNVYYHIPEFYTLYKTPSPPEIKRLRFYAREALIDSSAGNWDLALQNIGSLKSSWQMAKISLKPQQQEQSGKLDFSISELEKVIKEKNIVLTDIKGKILLNDTMALEKSFEQAESQQGGGQGGNQGGGQAGGQSGGQGGGQNGGQSGGQSGGQGGGQVSS